jgi:hypothetical protein
MIDPRLFASTPHRSRTGFEDLIGQVVLMHAALVPSIFAATGIVPRRFPIDAGAALPDLLQAIQAQHVSECQALGISPPPDLQSFDLQNPTDFASWTFLLGNDLTRIKAAAGVA